MKNKAFGIVAKLLGDNIQIAGLMLISEENETNILPNDDRKIHFSPNGTVFAPSALLRINYKLSIYDSLIFTYSKNNDTNANPNNDIYISNLKYNDKIEKKNGLKIFEYRENIFDYNGGYIDLEELSYKLNINRYISEDDMFYLKNQERILGPFVFSGGLAKPKEGKYVKSYKQRNIDKFIIKYNNDLSYFVPNMDFKKEFTYIDCSTHKQLSDWFSEKLKIIDNQVLDTLPPINQEFRKAITGVISMTDSDLKKRLYKKRLIRIFRCFEHMKLKKQELVSISNLDPLFKRIYKVAIDKQMEEIIKEYSGEIVNKKLILKNDIETLKIEQSNLVEDIDKLKRKKIATLNNINESLEPFKDKLKTIKEQIKSEEQSLKFAVENYDRLINDLKIALKINSNITSPKSHQINTIEPEENRSEANVADNVDNAVKRLQYYLAQKKIKVNYAKNILNCLSNYKCTMLPSIDYAGAVINALGNVRYIFQPVEADWIKYKKFHDNGLSQILSSCYEYKDIIHILILEDINLSSPECWGRPLFDIINDNRKYFPYLKKRWPRNLKILATYLPFSEPGPIIGLPLYKETFLNWGAIRHKTNFLDLNIVDVPYENLCIDLKTLKYFEMEPLDPNLGKEDILEYCFGFNHE